MEEDLWQPDEVLVLTVRTRCLDAKSLSGPDRSWIVASLTAQGWTVAAIAARLQCSLRLIQTIKTEPMTRVATFALRLAAEIAEERSLHHLEQAAAAAHAAGQQKRIERLVSQRDTLLAYIQLMRKGADHEAEKSRVSSMRRNPRRRSGAA